MTLPDVSPGDKDGCRYAFVPFNQFRVSRARLVLAARKGAKPAELFENNVTWLSIGNEAMQSLGLSAENRDSVLATMEHIGAITNITHTTAGRFSIFTIAANAAQIARQIKAQETVRPEPRDFMAEIKDTAKRNPVLAWMVIGFIVLTAALTFVNQLLQLLERMGK